MRIILLFFMLFIVTNIKAQDYLLKVLASRGDVKISNDGGKTFIKLFLGTKINKGNIIQLKSNSYLGLAHYTGKSIEIKNEGLYTTENLLNILDKQNSTTSTKYLKYIVDNVNEKKTENMSVNRHKYMSVVGSVERSTTSELNILLPKDKIQIFKDTIHLKWENTNNITRIDIANLFGDVVSTKMIKDSTIYLRITNNNERSFIINLEANNKMKSFNITRPSLTELITIENEYKLLLNDLNGETALNYIIQACFLEEKGFDLEAMIFYEKALKLENNDYYRKMYDDFLIRRF